MVSCHRRKYTDVLRVLRRRLGGVVLCLLPLTTADSEKKTPLQARYGTRYCPTQAQEMDTL